MKAATLFDEAPQLGTETRGGGPVNDVPTTFRATQRHRFASQPVPESALGGRPFEPDIERTVVVSWAVGEVAQIANDCFVSHT